MTRYLNKEELAKLSSGEFVEYQDAMNRKLVDDAPAPIRPRLEAILFRVTMECSFINDPVLRILAVNEKLIVAMTEFKDELTFVIDNLYSEDNNGDDK